MFGSKEATPKTIGTLIGAGTVIEGTVHYVGGLRVDGNVRGDLRSAQGKAGMVIISEHGKVAGEVHAAHLVISGQVNGPIHVSNLLELQPTARVTGDVHYQAIEIHQGAVVEGRLIHASASAAAQPAVGDDAADGRPALKLAAGGSNSES